MKKPTIPSGSWPALLREEFAAAYVGESSVASFLSRVGKYWPAPFIEIGTGKGKYRVWRKRDFDEIINPESLGGDPDPL